MYQVQSGTSLLFVAYSLITTIAMYFILEENNVDGWRSFIPVYGSYIIFKKFMSLPVFILYMLSVVAMIAGAVCMVLVYLGELYFYIGIGLLALGVLLYLIISIALDVSISHYHNKKGLFTFGMIFFTPFFLFALAWENRSKLR